MATASGTTEGKRRPVMPLVAYGVVLALLGLAVVAAVFRSGPVPSPLPASVEPALPARGLKLPPRPAASEMAAPAATAPAPQAPAQQEAAPSPSLSQAEPEKKPEPAKTECKVDLSRWPADKTDQAKAVQLLLRDLGLYRGTTNGTLGPATRTASASSEPPQGWKPAPASPPRRCSRRSRRNARRRRLNRRARLPLGREWLDGLRRHQEKRAGVSGRSFRFPQPVGRSYRRADNTKIAT